MVWQVLFTALLLGGSHYFAVMYAGAGKVSILNHIIAWSAGMAVYAAAAVCGLSRAAYAAVAAGNIALLAAETVRGRLRTAFPAAVICFCVDAVLVPMELCTRDMWMYGVLGLVLAASLLYALVYEEKIARSEWFSDIYYENRAAYFGLALMPLAGLMLEMAVTFIAYGSGGVGGQRHYAGIRRGDRFDALQYAQSRKVERD